jgi:hypothetical protein
MTWFVHKSDASEIRSVFRMICNDPTAVSVMPHERDCLLRSLFNVKVTQSDAYILVRSEYHGSWHIPVAAQRWEYGLNWRALDMVKLVF